MHFASQTPAETYCGHHRHQRGASGSLVELGHQFDPEHETAHQGDVTCTRCKRKLGLLPGLQRRRLPQAKEEYELDDEELAMQPGSWEAEEEDEE